MCFIWLVWLIASILYILLFNQSCSSELPSGAGSSCLYKQLEICKLPQALLPSHSFQQPTSEHKASLSTAAVLEKLG